MEQQESLNSTVENFKSYIEKKAREKSLKHKKVTLAWQGVVVHLLAWMLLFPSKTVSRPPHQVTLLKKR